MDFFAKYGKRQIAFLSKILSFIILLCLTPDDFTCQRDSTVTDKWIIPENIHTTPKEEIGS
jgi:hypothetical protein